VVDKWYPSRWGKDDEVGALNAIHYSDVLKAMSLVKKGKVYDLGRIIEAGIPSHPFHGPIMILTYHRQAEDLRSSGKTNTAGGMNTRLEMSDHTGTHLDGLNHISISERLYNGYDADTLTGAAGTSKLGMEKTPPIVTRGILVDVATHKGVKVLKAGESVTAKDLKDALAEEGVGLKRGDAVLVATGWGRLWMQNNRKYSNSCPGIDLSAAEWLAEEGIVIFGADTWNGEVDPTKVQRGADRVHQHLLVKNGIRIIENMYLEELQRDKVTEFLFVCLPLRLKGATASPVTPIAIA
jgi:kynurenine formamidase